MRTDKARASSKGRERFSMHVIVSLEFFDIFLSWNVQVASSHHCLNKATVTTAIYPFTSTALHSSFQIKHVVYKGMKRETEMTEMLLSFPSEHSLSLLFFISIVLSIQSFALKVVSVVLVFIQTIRFGPWPHVMGFCLCLVECICVAQGDIQCLISIEWWACWCSI